MPYSFEDEAPTQGYSFEDEAVTVPPRFLPPLQTPQETPPEWMGKYPTLAGVAGMTYETDVPQLAAMGGGAATGAAIGALGGPFAPVTVPAGAIIGAGLGYAAGRPITKALGEVVGEKQLETTPAQLGVDILTGAAYETGGRLIAPVLKGIGNLSDKISKRLYASGVAPKGELKQVERITAAGLRTGTAPTREGLAELSKTAAKMNEVIDAILVPAAKRGETVDRKTVTDSLQRLYKEAAESAKAEPNKAIIDEVVQHFSALPEKIPVDIAHNVKKNIYEEISSRAYAAGVGGKEMAQLEKSALKTMAHDIKIQLEALHPELKALTEGQVGFTGLKKSIEDVLAKQLKAPIAKHTAWEAITKRTIDNPRIKTSLAIALKRAREIASKEIKLGRKITPAPPVEPEFVPKTILRKRQDLPEDPRKYRSATSPEAEATAALLRRVRASKLAPEGGGRLIRPTGVSPYTEPVGTALGEKQYFWEE